MTAVLAAAATGCGASAATPAPACTASPQDILTALAQAPGRVRLGDGTRLSQCVARATEDGPLQEVGATFTAAADALAARADRDRAAALQLGYLVGATRRGAATTNGVALELAHRIESAAALRGATAGALAAEREGLAAGARGG